MITLWKTPTDGAMRGANRIINVILNVIFSLSEPGSRSRGRRTAMELMRIKTSDIVPDANNPRRDFGDIKELVEQLSVNPWAKGEPFNPLVVVSDGGEYRIVDGARRHAAMLHSKVEECFAVVCGDYDEAASAIAALATDAKKPLDDVERSRAIQSALRLGVPASKVERAGGLKHGQAKRIAAAAKWAGEKSLQATTDQLLAAKKLEDDGATREEARGVLEAAPGDWEDAAAAVRGRLDRERRLKDLEEALDRAGISPGAPGAGLGYDRTFRKEVDLGRFLAAGGSEGAVYCIDAAEGSVDVYVPVAEPMDAATEAARRVADASVDACNTGADDRIAWYLAALQRKASRPHERVRATPHVDAVLQKASWALESPAEVAADYGFEAGSFAATKALFAPMAIEAYMDAQAALELDERFVRMAVASDWGGIDPEALSLWVEWLSAFAADGFALDEVEAGMLAEARDHVGSSPEALQEDPDAGGVVPTEPEGGLDVDMLLDAAAAELRIADEAAPAAEAVPDGGDELDVAMLAFDGKAVV